MDVPVTELIGVYAADGGLLGEAAYVWGKLRGTRHCALCDITHSPVRRKPAWDRLVAGLGIPFELLHLNELPADVSAVVPRASAPAVLGRVDGELVVLLDSDTLDDASGSVDVFDELIRDRLAALRE